MAKRAAVLVDGGYFAKLMLAFNRPPIGIAKFSDEVCAPHERLRTYYYDAPPYVSPTPTPEERERKSSKDRYFDALRMQDRIEVRLGEVQRVKIPCPYGPAHFDFRQKLVDVILSVDMVKLAWSKLVDVIVLVSGDRDFVPAIRAAKDAGILVKAVYSTRSGLYVHSELLQNCDERVEVTDELIKRCLR